MFGGEEKLFQFLISRNNSINNAILLPHIWAYLPGADYNSRPGQIRKPGC